MITFSDEMFNILQPLYFYKTIHEFENNFSCIFILAVEIKIHRVTG